MRSSLPGLGAEGGLAGALRYTETLAARRALGFGWRGGGDGKGVQRGLAGDKVRGARPAAVRGMFLPARTQFKRSCRQPAFAELPELEKIERNQGMSCSLKKKKI